MRQPKTERKNPVGNNTNLRVNPLMEYRQALNLVTWTDSECNNWFGVIIAPGWTPGDMPRNRNKKGGAA